MRYYLQIPHYNTKVFILYELKKVEEQGLYALLLTFNKHRFKQNQG